MNLRISCIMTSMLIILASMSGCSSGDPDNVSEITQALSGPVAAYGFNEGSGTATADSSGNGLNGVASSTTWTTSGKFGKALTFSGVNGSWVTVQDNTLLHLTTGATLEAWVKPNGTQVTWPPMLMKEGSGALGYAIYAAASSTHSFVPNFDITSGGNEIDLYGGVKLTNNAWTHIAGTFDGSTMRLYIGGVLKSSVSQSGPIDNVAGVLRIGGDNVWPGEQFKGVIDEVRIYNRALSASEITTDMNTAIGSPPDAGPDTGIDTGVDTGTDTGQEAEASSDAAADTSDVREAEASADASNDVSQDAVADSSQDATGDAVTDTGSDVSNDAETGTASIFPLQLSSGKRYLVDQTGAPFFVKGDDAWSAITVLSLADVSTYLTDRASKDFNTVWMGMIDDSGPTGAIPNANGDLPFLKALDGTNFTSQSQYPDFSTPNEPYWAHVDQVLALTTSYNMLAVLSPEWLGYGCNQMCQTMIRSTPTQLQAYGQFLGQRYAAQANILWLPGGDTNPTDKTGIENIMIGLRQYASQLSSADTDDGTSPMDWWSGESWLGVDNIYSNQLLAKPFLYQRAQTEYQRANWKPFFMKEGCYEAEHNSTNQYLRAQSWNSILFGATGDIFGNGYVWQFASGWQAQLNSRGSQDMAVVHHFFDTRHWELLVPDFGHTFVTNAGDYTGNSEVTAAIASDGTWGALYKPNSEGTNINLAAFSKTVTGYWVDPTTGIKTVIAGSPFSNSGSVFLYYPPSAPNGNSVGDFDWVLLFE